MGDKRSYRDLVIAQVTHQGYTNTHLSNLDQSYNKLVERVGEVEVRQANTMTWIRVIRWVGGFIILGSITLWSKIQGLW